MKTRVTDLFGIEHPIIQGGMHYVGLAELAAAVSNAGGLGIITGLTQGTPAKLAAEIGRCQEMTDKPFGVNMTFLPSLTPPDYPGLFEVILDSGVKVVETAGDRSTRQRRRQRHPAPCSTSGSVSTGWPQKQPVTETVWRSWNTPSG